MFLYKINVLNISQNEFELPTFHRLSVPSHSLPPILLFFILLLVFIVQWFPLRADGVLKEVECFCQFVELVLDILDLLRYAVVLVGAISEIPPVLVTRPVHRRRNSLSFFTEGLFL